MKVLILSDRYLPDITGTSIRVAQLVQPLVQATSCDVHIATLTDRLTPSRTNENPTPAYEELDGVHVHRYVSERAMVSKLPGLHRRHQFDLFHARGIRYGFYSRIITSLFGIPSLLELNSVNPQTSPFKAFLWRYTVQQSDRLIVLANYATQWAIQEYGIPHDKIDVVVNGVDLKRFHGRNNQVRTELGIQDTTVIEYAGTFYEWQGVFDFVRVAAQVVKQSGNVRFLMVGNGPDYERTKQYVDRYNLDDVFIFTGLVHPEDVPKYMSAMDVFLLARPAHFLKNQLATPLKLLEAMAMECTVVVTPVSGLTEVVHDGKTGVVAGPSIESIARAIAELVNDKELRVRLARTARQDVAVKYSWDVASESLLKIYRKVTNQDAKW